MAWRGVRRRTQAHINAWLISETRVVNLRWIHTLAQLNFVSQSGRGRRPNWINSIVIHDARLWLTVMAPLPNFLLCADCINCCLDVCRFALVGFDSTSDLLQFHRISATDDGCFRSWRSKCRYCAAKRTPQPQTPAQTTNSEPERNGTHDETSGLRTLVDVRKRQVHLSSDLYWIRHKYVPREVHFGTKLINSR